MSGRRFDAMGCLGRRNSCGIWCRAGQFGIYPNDQSAGKVIAVARNRKRLERSLKFGADVIIGSSEEDVPAKIRELTNGEGSGFICEATETSEIIEESCEVARNGGKIILYGLSSEKAQIHFPVKSIIMKQLDVHGALGNSLSWESLLNLVASGRINLKDMVTHTYSLDWIADAFALLENKKEDPIKVIVYPWA